MEGRYQYELNHDKSIAELGMIGSRWIEAGARLDEAELRYHPHELFCLCEAISNYIENALAA